MGSGKMRTLGAVVAGLLVCSTAGGVPALAAPPVSPPATPFSVAPSASVTAATLSADDVVYEGSYVPGGSIKSGVDQDNLSLSELERMQNQRVPGQRTMTSEPLKPITVKQARAITAKNFGKGPGFEDRPASASAALSTAQRAAGGYDLLDKNSCIAMSKYQTEQGYGKNHYAWCAYGRVTVTKTVKGLKEAALVATTTVIGQGTREGRVMKFETYIDNITLIGQWEDGVALRASIWQAGWPTTKQCSMGGSFNGFVQQKQNVHFFSTAESSTSGSDGRDKKGTCLIAPTLTVSDAQGGWNGKLVDYGFRCDTAKGFGKNAVSACIFDRVASYVTFSRSNPLVAGAAEHIYLAQTNPGATVPKKKGKTIPLDLTRLYYDSKRRDANRNKARATCQKEFGKNYTDGKKDCDEYPFASTYQGASKADGNFSVKRVDATQNQKAGSDLNAWFKQDHIIDGDVFRVNVVA